MNQIIEEHSFSVLGVMEPPFQVYYRPKFAASEIISSEQVIFISFCLSNKSSNEGSSLKFYTRGCQTDLKSKTQLYYLLRP